jgi:hypothetical protein
MFFSSCISAINRFYWCFRLYITVIDLIIYSDRSISPRRASFLASLMSLAPDIQRMYAPDRPAPKRIKSDQPNELLMLALKTAMQASKTMTSIAAKTIVLPLLILQIYLKKPRPRKPGRHPYPYETNVFYGTVIQSAFASVLNLQVTVPVSIQLPAVSCSSQQSVR